jgi:hypothetical protein
VPQRLPSHRCTAKRSGYNGTACVLLPTRWLAWLVPDLIRSTQLEGNTVKTSSNPQALSNEIRALIAATPLAVFLRAALGTTQREGRVTRGTQAARMQASA